MIKIWTTSEAQEQAAIAFLCESNGIEGIYEIPSPKQIKAYFAFMALEKITIKDLTKFVKVIQPNAALRNKRGLDVRVGNYHPPSGGKQIVTALEELLDLQETASAYDLHIAYESLHPYTDGNGRSGRMLWMWKMKYAPLGFLHTFYYQTLENSGREI